MIPEKWPNERTPDNRSEKKWKRKKNAQPMRQGNIVNRGSSQTEQQATHDPLVG